MINSIGFEGLGIGPFDINRVAFSIAGKFDIYWYAIIITVGMILGILFAMKFAKKVSLTSDDIIDAALWGTPFALIGARLYYIAFSLDSFKNANGNIDLGKIVDFRNGGLAIYGGIIAAFIVAVIVCKVKKKSFLALFDIAALSFLIGQAVGRWGNFINAEAFGEKTDLPWGMTINGSGPFHPTFLYESLWNIIGFIILFIFLNKLRKHNGEVFFGYLIWYGIGRGWIEGLRTDSLWLFTDSFSEKLGGFNLRISQILSIVLAVVGLICFILARKGVFEKIAAKRHEKKNCSLEQTEITAGEESYTPMFGDIAEKAESDIIINEIESNTPAKNENNADIVNDIKENPINTDDENGGK